LQQQPHSPHHHHALPHEPRKNLNEKNRQVDEWALVVADWASAWGVAGGGVLLVDELSTGDDTRGSEVHGLPRELLLRALKVLETKGKAKLFRGASPEEEGVKFL
jgi:ESCRT-II complex subunit VPS25